MKKTQQAEGRTREGEQVDNREGRARKLREYYLVV